VFFLLLFLPALGMSQGRTPPRHRQDRARCAAAGLNLESEGKTTHGNKAERWAELLSLQLKRDALNGINASLRYARALVHPDCCESGLLQRARTHPPWAHEVRGSASRATARRTGGAETKMRDERCNPMSSLGRRAVRHPANTHAN
jgi:hypothetical protein